MAKILDGKAVAAGVRAEVAAQVAELKERGSADDGGGCAKIGPTRARGVKE